MAIQNTRTQGLNARKNYMRASSGAGLFNATSPKPMRSPLPVGGGGDRGGTRGTSGPGWGGGGGINPRMQDALIQQELQSRREADLRSWAELALKERGLDFSQSMATRQADQSEWLQNQREGREQEEFNFGMDRAQIKGGQEDELHGLRVQHLGNEEDRTQTRFNFDLERDYQRWNNEDDRHKQDRWLAYQGEDRAQDSHQLQMFRGWHGAERDIVEGDQRDQRFNLEQSNMEAAYEMYGPTGRPATGTGASAKGVKAEDVPGFYFNMARNMGFNMGALQGEDGQPSREGMDFMNAVTKLGHMFPEATEEEITAVAAQHIGLPTQRQALEQEIAELEANTEGKGFFFDSADAKTRAKRLEAAKAELEEMGQAEAPAQAGAMGQGAASPAGPAGPQGAGSGAVGAASENKPPAVAFIEDVRNPETMKEIETLFSSDAPEDWDSQIGLLDSLMRISSMRTEKEGDPISTIELAGLWEALPKDGKFATLLGIDTPLVTLAGASPSAVWEEIGLVPKLGKINSKWDAMLLLEKELGISREEASAYFDKVKDSLQKAKALQSATKRAHERLMKKIEDRETEGKAKFLYERHSR